MYEKVYCRLQNVLRFKSEQGEFIIHVNDLLLMMDSLLKSEQAKVRLYQEQMRRTYNAETEKMAAEETA